MQKDKPRLARLSAMLIQLQSKRLITAREMAEKYEISIRTVYRDIRTLEQSGVPIVTHEGKGYSILEGYHLPPIMLTEEEALALITAEHIILKNKDQSLIDKYQSAISKIKSVLRGSQKIKTELLSERIQVRNNRDQVISSKYLISLQSCVASYKLVHLKYLSIEQKESSRKVEPFALYTTNENWVLIAFCRNRKDFRAFRLDRIQKLTVLEEVFDPHPMTLDEYLRAVREKYKNTPDIPLS